MYVNLNTLLVIIIIISSIGLVGSQSNDHIQYGRNTYKLLTAHYENFRNGRLFSYPQNPIIDMVMKSASKNYIPQNPSDPFDFLRDDYRLPGDQTTPDTEYDFVIIGAGSAGSALASRLTEKKWAKVLVLEAGKPEMLFTDIPALAPYFQSTDYSWPYYMDHQPGVCMGMENERCYWPRGKAVGGTSVINYMIYTRGRPQDWDRIARDGNYGWSYNDVLQYYIKSERANLKGFEKNPYRGRDGKLDVNFIKGKTRLIKAFLNGGRLLGHPTVDYNSPDGFGFGYVQVTMDHGRRKSAARAYLLPHRKRKNLHILPESRVTKILIDPVTKEAYGVEYVRNRIKYVVKARKEVILSAGPIASPQLLMLSGIGPRDHLQSLSIPITADLPVGKTIYDHICFPGLIYTVRRNTSFTEERLLNLKSMSDWLRNGDGGLNSAGGVEGIGYIKTRVSDDPELVPDIELLSFGGSMLSDGGQGGSKAIRKGMRLTDNIVNAAFGTIDNTDTYSIIPMLLHPKSNGFLELKDANPFSHPRMVGNYLTSRKDVATFIAAIRYIQAIVSTESFENLDAKIHNAQIPTCSSLVFDTDEYWECALRTFTMTLHHQIATCRMGPVGDQKAVVDPELRVHGIKRLRVVDSSVIPRTISAHTNAPAIMIGEKAADLIKNAWTKK